MSDPEKGETDVNAETGLSRLVIGVDGGGSKTAALLASVDEKGEIVILGRGRGGPSNLFLAGKEQSLASLNQAIDEAMDAAGVSGQKPDYAVLALAGSTSPDVQHDVAEWAEQRGLSERFEIVHDVAPVLAMGAGEGEGVALIVGTGSVAVGIDAGVIINPFGPHGIQGQLIEPHSLVPGRRMIGKVSQNIGIALKMCSGHIGGSERYRLSRFQSKRPKRKHELGINTKRR